MRRWILWLNVLEKRLWGRALNANPYFASLVVALSMFAGAALCDREMLQAIVPSFAALNGTALAGLLVMLYGFVLCESICACRSLDVMILRTLLVLLLSVLAAAVGYLIGLPLLLFSVAWIVALVADIFIVIRR